MPIKIDEENKRKDYNFDLPTLEIIPLKYRDLECHHQKLADSLRGKSVFITGKIGVGKTVLMAELVKRVIRDGQPVQWISYPAFIMQLQNAYRDEEDNPYKMAKEIATYEGTLAVDDLGVPKLTDYVRQISYYIFNEREQRVLPTLITSNFGLKEINEMIDPRISSRIAGMCEIVELEGRDKRLKQFSRKDEK
jgi:DNA replication protein DnaC